MGKKGGGPGTTLVLALVIVVLGISLGVGLARYGSTLPVVGSLLAAKSPRTTTGPVVVEGVQGLDQLATVRWTESVPDRDFSPLNVHPDDDLVEKARLRAVEKIEDAARENKILETAERNAEVSIRAFVITLGFERVRFR